LKSVRESTAAASSAVSVLKRYMAIIRRPWTGMNPKTFDGGYSAPITSA
jgi:hypothetical protein